MSGEQRIKGFTPSRVILDEVAWDDWREALAVMSSPAAYRQHLAENMPADIPAEIIDPPDEPYRPRTHTWETRTLTAGLTVEACIHGDALRRRDGHEPPCRGPHRIDLRSTLL